MTWLLALLCVLRGHDGTREYPADRVVRLRCRRCHRVSAGWDLRDLPVPRVTMPARRTRRLFWLRAIYIGGRQRTAMR